MDKPKMMCEVFRETNEKRKEELDRGDIVKPTYQRWTRCADYMEEFFRSSLKTPDIPIKEVTSGILDDFQHYLRMKKDRANNAAVRYLRCVKNVMQYALAHKWITHDTFVVNTRTFTDDIRNWGRLQRFQIARNRSNRWNDTRHNRPALYYPLSVHPD